MKTVGQEPPWEHLTTDGGLTPTGLLADAKGAERFIPCKWQGPYEGYCWMSEENYSTLANRFLQYQGAWYDSINSSVEGYYRVFAKFRSWTIEELDAIVRGGEWAGIDSEPEHEW